MKTVSVIVPTYNRATLLVETLESILAQTYPAIEIIVVDDGSTDETKQTVARYGERVTYLRQENQGETVARNAGFRVSRGDYVSFLDDDDLILPTKIEKQVKVLDTRPDIGMVYCRHYRMDEQGNWLSKVGLLPEGRVLLPLALSDFIWAGGPLIRRTCFEAVGAYDTTLPWNGRYAEDWDLLLRLALKGYVFACVQEPLGAYRLTKIGQTANIAPSEEGNIAVLDKLFAQPDLPEDVAAAKGRIYAGCYLWLSSRYYAAAQWSGAQRTLNNAIRHYPALLEQPDEWWRNMSAQALSHRVADPIAFAQGIFDHLLTEAQPFVAYREKLLGHIHLHLALRYYFARQVAEAQQHFRQALGLMPNLLREPQQFVETLSHTVFHLPLADHRDYVDAVLRQLPDEAQALCHLRPQILGHIYIAAAFEAFANRQRPSIIRYGLLALRYHPGHLKNRGVLSILMQAVTGSFSKASQTS